jgi:hypothetical protein
MPDRVARSAIASSGIQPETREALLLSTREGVERRVVLSRLPDCGPHGTVTLRRTRSGMTRKSELPWGYESDPLNPQLARAIIGRRRRSCWTIWAVIGLP